MQEVMASDDVEMHLPRLCFDRSQIIKASRLPYSFSDFIVRYPRSLMPLYLLFA